MPYLKQSGYKAPSIFFKNGHFSTIYMARVFKSPPPEYQRERLELGDGDFLDIDFKIKNKRKALILCHGLEGASTRTYNNSAAKYFLNDDFSIFAWNNRSCSGEMNRLPRLYHHGDVDDLNSVVNFVINKGFEEIRLMGFSMGGVHLLNYFGRKEIDSRVKSGVAVSAPIYLKDTAEKLKRGFHRIYLKKFMMGIQKKMKLKSEQFPDVMDWEWLKTMKSFDEVDEYFTAPMHGYADKEDFYKRASPGSVIENIQTPVLIINALDDPFLDSNSYPKDFSANSEFVFLETPLHGGHCAFPVKNSRFCYSEIRAKEFFNSN